MQRKLIMLRCTSSFGGNLSYHTNDRHASIEAFENVFNLVRVRIAPSPSGGLHLRIYLLESLI
ncbi:MAG: hypothetical protein ACTS42_00155 [Candidatus Hodgkinia cicadicola]